MNTGKTIELPFAVGSDAWIVTGPHDEQLVTCPDCAGTCIVTMRLGNGEEHAIQCGQCCHAYQPEHPGRMKRYGTAFRAKRVSLDTFSGIRDGNYEYRSLEGYCYSTENLFATEAEALAKCESRRPEAERHAEMMMKNHLDCSRKSNAFTVSYYRRKKGELEKELAWVTEKLNAKPLPLPGARGERG